MRLGQLTCNEHIYRRTESIWWINDRIAKGFIQSTYEELPEIPTYEQSDEVLKQFIFTKGGIPYRIGAKEQLDGKLAIHFPAHLKIALMFLNSELVFMHKKLLDYEDAGVFESIHIEIYVVPLSSKVDHTAIL